jgi:hypothetical protein
MGDDEHGDLDQRLDIGPQRFMRKVDLPAELDAERRRLTIEWLDVASRLMEERCINEHRRVLARMRAAKSK